MVFLNIFHKTISVFVLHNYLVMKTQQMYIILIILIHFFNLHSFAKTSKRNKGLAYLLSSVICSETDQLLLWFHNAVDHHNGP